MSQILLQLGQGFLDCLTPLNLLMLVVGITIPILRKIWTQAGDDDRVWKQTGHWAAKRLPQGRYDEVPEAKHEIMMEIDAVRAVFLAEFDALADRVAPPT